MYGDSGACSLGSRAVFHKKLLFSFVQKVSEKEKMLTNEIL